jgi:RNA recognition motif-containing protein
MNIFVGNLEYHVSEDELKEAFGNYGTVESVKIVTDRNTGRSKGFGFVDMPDDKEAQAAVDAMNGQELNGRPITVNESRKPEENRGGFEDRGQGRDRRDFSRDRERGRRDRY